MSLLNKFADKQSRTVKVREGEPVVVTIKDYAEGLSQDGKPVMNYQCELDGSVKVLTSSSGSLARQIGALPNEGKGCLIEITRTGEGIKTKYIVKAL